ncbi:hypothetical protein DY000_02052501 [Brassica cretica]|uniref:Uncharacterized protein n=1 Tax=Brassica cretica TaxID=69181 RepID=A0ABQ7A8G8_BRACR|nr:hypothetical protein DY000_02052501 [Brassica cretica]
MIWMWYMGASIEEQTRMHGFGSYPLIDVRDSSVVTHEVQPECQQTFQTGHLGVFEVDLSPTLKRPGQKSIIDFQRDVWWIQQAKNQEERPSEVEDIIIFPKPVIRRELWKDWEINLANYLQTKNTQPRQPPHDPRHPEDTSNDSEEPYIVLPYTNKHWNKRIFISGSFGSNSLKSASISSCRLLDHQQLGSFFSLVLLQEEPPDQSSIKQAVQRNKPINCPI